MVDAKIRFITRLSNLSNHILEDLECQRTMIVVDGESGPNNTLSTFREGYALGNVSSQ